MILSNCVIRICLRSESHINSKDPARTSHSHHLATTRPVEFRSRDWQDSPHTLKYPLLQSLFKDFFNLALIVSLNFLDCFHDVRAIGSLESYRWKVFSKIKLNVSFFEVVIVDSHRAVKLILLGVNDPLSLPFTTPACIQLEINARDIDLQVSILIEAKAGSCGFILIVNADILINLSLHSIS